MPTTLDVIQGSLLNLWENLLGFLPQLIAALVVFIVGLIIAALLRRLVIRVVDVLKLDDLSEKLGLTPALRKYGFKFNIGRLLGWLIKWFVVVAFLIATVDILQWHEVTVFLTEVVLYLPNVVIAVVILLVGLLLANFVQEVVKAAVEAAKLASATALAGIAKWSIVVFSFMAALVQLGIAERLVNTLFTGFVAMLALAGGLAFGLGGKDHASKLVSRLKRDISNHE